MATETITLPREALKHIQPITKLPLLQPDQGLLHFEVANDDRSIEEILLIIQGANDSGTSHPGTAAYYDDCVEDYSHEQIRAAVNPLSVDASRSIINVHGKAFGIFSVFLIKAANTFTKDEARLRALQNSKQSTISRLIPFKDEKTSSEPWHQAVQIHVVPTCNEVQPAYKAISREVVLEEERLRRAMYDRHPAFRLLQ